MSVCSLVGSKTVAALPGIEPRSWASSHPSGLISPHLTLDNLSQDSDPQIFGHILGAVWVHHTGANGGWGVVQSHTLDYHNRNINTLYCNSPAIGIDKIAIPLVAVGFQMEANLVVTCGLMICCCGVWWPGIWTRRSGS